MGLMEDIEVEIKKSKMPKWRILKETVGEEIEVMIESGMTIDKQIELIIKNKILDKLDRKEYTNIIKKHFGYQGRNQKKIVTSRSPVVTENIVIKKAENKGRNIEQKLSQDVDLMSTFLKKKSQL